MQWGKTKQVIRKTDTIRKIKKSSCIYIYPTPPLGQDITQGQFF